MRWNRSNHDWRFWRKAPPCTWGLKVYFQHETTWNTWNSRNVQNRPIILKMAHYPASVQKLTVPSANQAAPKIDLWRKKLRVINLAKVQFGDRLLNARPKKQSLQFFLKLFQRHWLTRKTETKNSKNSKLRLRRRLMFIGLKRRAVRKRQPQAVWVFILPLSITQPQRRKTNLPQTLNSLPRLPGTQHSPAGHSGIFLERTRVGNRGKAHRSPVD